MWRWILLTACVACAPAADDAPPPEPPAPEPPRMTCPEERDARFDALAEQVEAERQALGAPGVAIAVMVDGELAWCEGFGSRDPEGEEPMGAQTLLRIGSITKALTALALLQEVERGTLDLDATLPEVLGSDWQFALDPTWADAMRVEDLLTHQGGFYDYLELDADRHDSALTDWVDGWMLDHLFLMAPPGQFFNYSNPNYTVAGRLIEHGAEATYDARMKELFHALDMQRTALLPDDVLADGDYAVGDSYDWKAGTAARLQAGPEDYDNAWGRPAGYAWSSVEDLGQLARFLMDGDEAVLADALRLDMMAPMVEMGGIPGLAHYGYGLMVMDGIFLESGYHPLRWISHGGVLPGFSAEIHVVPEQGFALITLANGDGAFFTDTLVEVMDAWVDLPAPTAGPDLTPPDPAAYVGTYEDPWNVGPWIFSVDDDGDLAMDMPLLDQLNIPYHPKALPLYGDTFAISVQGLSLELTFIRDEDTPRWASTRYFVAERAEQEQDDPVAARAPDPHRLLHHLAQPAAPLQPAARLLERIGTTGSRP